jgi:hypothetical protein
MPDEAKEARCRDHAALVDQLPPVLVQTATTLVQARCVQECEMDAAWVPVAHGALVPRLATLRAEVAILPMPLDARTCLLRHEDKAGRLTGAPSAIWIERSTEHA